MANASVRPTLFLTILIGVTLTMTSAASNTVSQVYRRCPAGLKFSGQEVRTTSARSVTDCCTKCSQDAACKAVNLCRDNLSTAVICSMLSDHNPAICDSGLVAASSSSCYFMQKLCKNGGTPVGNKCACPIQYSGKYCQRLIRDCTEAFRNGYQNDSLSGGYFIQPLTAPDPFLVNCKFDWGGVTYPFKREAPFSFTVDWATAKRGFRNDNATNPTFSAPAFIGLENLHHLTAQANYKIHLYLWSTAIMKSGGAFYTNFRVGDVSSNYSLNYDTFFPNSGMPTQNGFNVTALPMSFATYDHDPNGCAAFRGGPGWYGSSCDGYSIFTSTFTWPFNGTAVNTDTAYMILERYTDFYVPT